MLSVDFIPLLADSRLAVLSQSFCYRHLFLSLSISLSHRIYKRRYISWMILEKRMQQHVPPSLSPVVDMLLSLI